MSSRPAGVVALMFTVVGLSLVVGCAPINVRSYTGPRAELRHYRTYAWGPRDEGPTGDPRLDNNRFFDEYVRRQVDSELVKRGFEKADSAPSELVVYYHARVSQQVDSRRSDRVQADCLDDGCDPFIYDKGTLLIDLVEYGSNTLVWRGWAEASIEGFIDNQAWMEARIEDTVAKILARLPDRLSRTAEGR